MFRNNPCLFCYLLLTSINNDFNLHQSEIHTEKKKTQRNDKREFYVSERKKKVNSQLTRLSNRFVFFCFCLHSSDSTARDRTKTKWRTRWRKRSQLNRTGR